MAFILDTSFVIRYLKGDADAVARLDEIKTTRAPILLPAPAYYELRVGYEVFGNQEEYEQFLETIRDMQVPAFDRGRAAVAARLQARLRDLGRTGGPVDSMILSFPSRGSDTLVARDGPMEEAAQALGIQVDQRPESANS